MIGLLKKDLYVADKSGRMLLVLALVFSLVPSLGTLGSTYAMMLAFMLPLNSIAYDERCKWDRYAAMLPYQTRQIVWSKYVLSYIYTALAEAVILGGALIRGVMTPGSVTWKDTLEVNVMLAVVMLLMIALGLPMLYRFGSERGRLVMILVLACGVAISFAVMQALGLEGLPLPPAPVLAAAAVLLTAAATYASFRLSVYFYKKRQNGAYN